MRTTYNDRITRDSRHYLDERGELDDLPDDREVIVDREGHEDCQRVKVVGQRNRDCVDEKGHEDSSASARQYHGDELVGDGRPLRSRCKHLAAVQKRVADHAHEEDLLL